MDPSHPEAPQLFFFPRRKAKFGLLNVPQIVYREIKSIALRVVQGLIQQILEKNSEIFQGGFIARARVRGCCIRADPFR